MTEAAWTLILRSRPQKVLGRVDAPTRARLVAHLREMERDPWIGTKLRGYEDVYRVRVGQWRIVYVIDADHRRVVVLRIMARGNVYDHL